MTVFAVHASMPRRTPRAHGQPTRGKTALNRLRQVDVYIALAHPGILTTGSPLVIDSGYGAQAWTALEMFERWLTLNPALRLLGVEIDAERVAAALPYQQPGRIEFRLGGFNLSDVLGGEKARLIRAYNVLRQYDESVVEPALAMLAEALEPGGLLIEGTSNPSGRLVVFDVYRKMDAGQLCHEELVFGTNFRERVEPVDFQAVLPKRLIHHAQDAAPAAFFNAWRSAFALARGAGHHSPRHQWIYAAKMLRERFNFPVDTRPRILRRGFLALHNRLDGNL
jgi:hypothetical protein